MRNTKVKVVVISGGVKGEQGGGKHSGSFSEVLTFYFLTWVGSSHVFIIMFHLCNIQTYLRDISGLVPDHHNKVSHNLFAGEGSYFCKKQHNVSEVQ